MNDQPFRDDAPPAGADDKRFPLTMLLLGAGFIGGLLCGLAMLSRTAPTDDAAVVANKFSTPEREQNAAQLVAADVTNGEQQPVVGDEHESLIDERARLEAELETLQLKQQVAELQTKLNRLQTTPVSTDLPATGDDSTPSGQGASTEAAPSGEATLAFWNRMNDVIDREAAMRSAPLGGITASNAGGFLEARIQSAEYAVDALGKISTSSVDHRALEVSAALLAWYEQGRDVALTGRDLLSQSSENRQGTAGKRYQDGERAYSEAVNEVNTLGERVRQQLSRDYGIPFPALK